MLLIRLLLVVFARTADEVYKRQGEILREIRPVNLKRYGNNRVGVVRKEEVAGIMMQMEEVSRFSIFRGRRCVVWSGCGVHFHRVDRSFRTGILMMHS